MKCPEIDRMPMFRDWLRGNDADHDLYACTKRALAGKERKSVQNYADAKSVMARAGAIGNEIQNNRRRRKTIVGAT